MTAEGHSGLPSWEPRPLLLLPKILLGEKTRAALSWGKATPCLSLIPFLSFFFCKALYSQASEVKRAEAGAGAMVGAAWRKPQLSPSLSRLLGSLHSNSSLK